MFYGFGCKWCLFSFVICGYLVSFGVSKMSFCVVFFTKLKFIYVSDGELALFCHYQYITWKQFQVISEYWNNFWDTLSSSKICYCERPIC